MEITINRECKRKGYTLSRLYLDGTYFGCLVLEDEDRGLDKDTMTLEEIKKKKVYAETAIPKGRYKVIFSTSPKFGKSSYAKDGMIPLVCNVPGWSGVRIHAANKATELEGCLAIGKNTKVGEVTDSRAWTKKLIDRLWLAWSNGSPIYLTIK